MNTAAALAPLPPPESPGSRVAFRAYRGPADLPAMMAANNAAGRRCGVLETIDAGAMTHTYTHLVNSDPLVDCMVAERDGRTVGYCRVQWHDLADGDRGLMLTCIVEPGAWGLGVAGAFVDWAEARLRQIAAEIPRDRRAWLSTWVWDGYAELEAALVARGYAGVRWGAEMVRPAMDDLPAVRPLPARYAIRPLTADRYRDVAEMNVLAFRDEWGEIEGETGHQVEDWLDNPRFDPDLVSVAWHGDEPAACVSIQVQDGADDAPIAYVDGVATHPAHRRRGLARACLADALRRVAARGLTSAYLTVDTDNVNRAFALYEEAGFVKASTSTTYRKAFDIEEGSA